MRRRFLLLRDAGLILLSLGAVVSQFGVKLAIVNESPSLPKGLYLRAPISSPKVGAIVAFRPPPAAKAYLRELGMPPDGLLLKRVAAAAGDEVCASRRVVTTPTRRVDVRASDRHGRALPTWSGCKRLAPGDVFVLGDTAASFDSRYFGPVPRQALVGVFWEAATW